MTCTLIPDPSVRRAGRDGFLQVLHAEWTKFRTVRGWVVGMAAAALMVVLVALLAGVSSVHHDKPGVPLGPRGEPVTDSFYFVHQPLVGNGSITVAVSALSESSANSSHPDVVPWAKAGLIIKQSTRPGSPYAAIMVTSGHGVRMQDDFINDTAGLPGPASTTSPRWLRLERSGDTLTGYDSIDGTRWTTVSTVRMDGLGSTVEGGMFVASPDSVHGIGTSTTVATAVFGDLSTQGGWLSGKWVGDPVAPESPDTSGHPQYESGSFTQSDNSVTVSGTGDIAPAVRATLPSGGTIAEILTGTFAALIAVIVVGTLFITAEYRQNMIHVTLTAHPRRGRVLAAKAIVLGGVTFAAGLVGAAIAIPLGTRLARANGVYVFPATPWTLLRVDFGTAVLLATTSVLALAVATMFRRGAGAVTTVLAVIVLPYILIAQIPFLPGDVSGWLARTTPAAAFAVQQTLTPYRQVTSLYTPYDGYYPLAPWAGFAVLAGYAALALAAAAVVLRRRDA